MNNILKYLGDLFKGIGTLWTGMKVTAKYFYKNMPGARIFAGEIVTQQYPENRKTLQMFDRFKGEVTMPHNADNKHKCTGCGICEMNCPNGSIEVLTSMQTVDGKKKKVLDKHIYHLSMCTFCGLCVKTCPSDALAFGQGFEHAVFNRSALTKVLNKPGSELEKEEKKEAPKVETPKVEAPKAEAPKAE